MRTRCALSRSGCCDGRETGLDGVREAAGISALFAYPLERVEAELPKPLTLDDDPVVVEIRQQLPACDERGGIATLRPTRQHTLSAGGCLAEVNHHARGQRHILRRYVHEPTVGSP